MREKKRIMRWTYALCAAAILIWLAYSTPLFAVIENGTSVHKESFSDIREKYLKDHIYYVIDNNRYDGGMFEKLSIDGWAFCETEEGTSHRSVSIVLRGNKNTYELTQYIYGRLDVPVTVPRQLNRPDMKINQATGFIGQFSLLDIKNDTYDIYLCCWENETNHGMEDTFRQLIKEGDSVNIVDWSTPPMDEIVLTTQEAQTLGYLDRVTIDGNMISVYGWEFAPGKDTFDQSVYVEITDQNGKVVQYPAKMITRADVSTAYKSPLYAQSGYQTVFEDDNFEDGTYTIRVLVENGGEVWRSKQYTAIKKGNKVEVMQY